MSWRLFLCVVWILFGALGCGRDTPPDAAGSSQSRQSKADAAAFPPDDRQSTRTPPAEISTPMDASVVTPPSNKPVGQPITPSPAATSTTESEQPKPQVDPSKPKVTTLVILPVEDLIADAANPVIALSDEAKQAGMVESPNPCIAVRGLFPNVRQFAQIIQILKPTGLSPTVPDMLDFELQRQQVAGKQTEWDNVPWEKVDIKTAESILRNTAGFADEPLPHVVSNVITMPMPLQKNGEWNDNTFHPRLTKKGYELHQQMQLERNKPAADAAELEEIVKQIYTEMENRLRERIGDDFNSKLQRQQGFNRRASLHMLEATLPVKPFAPPDLSLLKPGQRAPVPHQIVEAEYLLFRLIDFSVKAGDSYRYRVRLQLFNPFYGSPLQVQPRERFLKTPWSSPTPAVFVSK